MSHDEDWPADGPGHAHYVDVLAHTLREMAVPVVLPDPQTWGPDDVDQDPLSPESLGAQTGRLLKLIKRAKDQKDVSLLHSLRRELLLTRWALVKVTPGALAGRGREASGLSGQDSRRDSSDQRVGLQHPAGGPKRARPASPIPPPRPEPRP